MKTPVGFIVIITLLISGNIYSQEKDTVTVKKDTLIKKIDSLSIKSDSLKNGETNIIKQENYNENTKLDFNTYFILLGNDFKQQVVLPFHTKKKDWVRVAGFAAIVGGVAIAERGINRYAVKVTGGNKGVAQVSKFVTNTGGIYEVATLGAIASYGFIFQNEKVKTTALLASQAYITSAVMFTAIKFITGRQRPSYYYVEANRPSFHGPFFQFRKDLKGIKLPNSAYTSFPSGHTTVAFAAATVFAMEYHDRPIIPIISYSAASLIGLSRITENKHWATDVLVGAGLGYLIGKQVVNNYHRYSRVKSQLLEKKKRTTFNFQSVQGKILPGLSYNLGSFPKTLKPLPL